MGRNKKAQGTSFIRDVLIGLALIVVLLIIVAIASGQLGRWIKYLSSLLGF